MPIVFACAASHAPGMTAWTEAAPQEQRNKILGSYQKLGEMLAASKPDVLVVVSVEHWANFFLDQMPTFCIGRAGYYDGPVEEWLKISKTRVPGDPALGAQLLDTCLDSGFDPAFSDELLFDPRDDVAAAFSKSWHDRAGCTADYQHLDDADALTQALFRIRPGARESSAATIEKNCVDCHRRSLPLARGSEDGQNQCRF
jgi:hypothetical protein